MVVFLIWTHRRALTAPLAPRTDPLYFHDYILMKKISVAQQTTTPSLPSLLRERTDHIPSEFPHIHSSAFPSRSQQDIWSCSFPEHHHHGFTLPPSAHIAHRGRHYHKIDHRPHLPPAGMVTLIPLVARSSEQWHLTHHQLAIKGKH